VYSDEILIQSTRQFLPVVLHPFNSKPLIKVPLEIILGERQPKFSRIHFESLPKNYDIKVRAIWGKK